MKENFLKSASSFVFPLKKGFMFLGLFLFSVGSLISQSHTATGVGQGGDPQSGTDATVEFTNVLDQADLVGFDEALTILAEAITDTQQSLANLQSPSSSVIRQANIKSDYWRVLMNLVNEAESDPEADMSSVMISSIANLSNIFTGYNAANSSNALNLFEETIDMLKK